MTNLSLNLTILLEKAFSRFLKQNFEICSHQFCFWGSYGLIYTLYSQNVLSILHQDEVQSWGCLISIKDSSIFQIGLCHLSFIGVGIEEKITDWIADNAELIWLHGCGLHLSQKASTVATGNFYVKEMREWVYPVVARLWNTLVNIY